MSRGKYIYTSKLEDAICAIDKASLRTIPTLAGFTAHVHECDLGSSDDSAIWEYAKANGLSIVSKDSDFQARSVLFGAPPKVVWLRAKNCTSSELETLLRRAFPTVKKFILEAAETCLILEHRQLNG